MATEYNRQQWDVSWDVVMNPFLSLQDPQQSSKQEDMIRIKEG